MTSRTVDDVTKFIYGRTASQAVAKSICVACEKHIEPRRQSEEQRDIYLRTGLCAGCFSIFSERLNESGD
jgi:hypothetical protein